MAGPKGNTKATVHDVFIARVKDLHNRLSKKVKDGLRAKGNASGISRKLGSPPWIFTTSSAHDGF